MALTARQVETAKPKDKAYKLTDGEGLYLYVSPAGGKSWRANYTQAGKQKTRTYGQWPQVSLAEARTQHRDAKGTPAATAPQQAKKPLFETVAKDWLFKHLPGLSNPKHRLQVESTLETFAYPRLGKLPIDQIPRTLLVEVVKGVQRPGQRKDRVETAHRVAGRITAVFDYALDAGILDSHPAAGLNRVLQARTTKQPMASIRREEAGQLMRDIDTYPELVTRLGLQLAAYTFPRVSEILGFRSDELREDGAIWVVPAERVKGEGEKKLPHVIPLARQVRPIVERLIAMSGCELVLESPDRPGHALSENTLLFALYRLGYKGRMTVHGFRALASTVLNESSGFADDVIERQLAHKETDLVRAAYNRAEYLPQRRELMQWWADWLDAQRAAP
jgi:integrase